MGLSPRRPAPADHARPCGWPTSIATASTPRSSDGCLMINELIEDAGPARLDQPGLQRLGRRLRQAQRPRPGLPPRHHPEHRSGPGRRRGAALRQARASGRRPRVQAPAPPPLPSRLGSPLGGRPGAAGSQSPSISQRASRGCWAPDTPQMEKEYAVTWRLVLCEPVPARRDGGAGLPDRIGGLRAISGVQVRPRRGGRNLDPLRVRSPGHRVRGPRPIARVLAEAQRLLPAPGVHDLPAGPVSRARHPHRRARTTSSGAPTIPHPDCLWPDSRRHLEKNLGSLPERVRRKITVENVSRLYQLP